MFCKDDFQVTLLSEMQGDIFEESVINGYDSKKFIEAFMHSNTAWHLDLPMHKASWLGKGYVSDEFWRENEVPKGKTLNQDLMYWIGHVYRFWHCATGQYSKEIYSIANPEVIIPLYPRLNCMPFSGAIKRIFEDRKLPFPATKAQKC